MSYSRLTGYGIPWVMIALSRATTGLPSCNAQRTSSETRNTESGRKRSEIHNTKPPVHGHYIEHLSKKAKHYLSIVHVSVVYLLRMTIRTYVGSELQRKHKNRLFYTYQFNTNKIYKPVDELARVLLSFKRPTRRHRTANTVPIMANFTSG